jgi:hypothetical protein
MALDLDNLAGHVGEVLREVRPFTLAIPGIVITGEVLRGDHPDWKQHLLDLQAERPEVKRQRKVVNERVFSGLEPKGFRQKKKPSETQAHQEMLAKLSEEETLQIEVYTIRDQKDGIATILLKKLEVNGETTVRRGGVEHDLSTPAGRLAFMDHETWEFTEGTERKELSIPVYKDGEPDDFGERERNELGGWNFGDAIAKSVLQEADDLAAFVEKRKADVLDSSGATSTGVFESGSPSQPPPEE